MPMARGARGDKTRVQNLSPAFINTMQSDCHCHLMRVCVCAARPAHSDCNKTPAIIRFFHQGSRRKPELPALATQAWKNKVPEPAWDASFLGALSPASSEYEIYSLYQWPGSRTKAQVKYTLGLVGTSRAPWRATLACTLNLILNPQTLNVQSGQWNMIGQAPPRSQLHDRSTSTNCCTCRERLPRAARA